MLLILSILPLPPILPMRSMFAPCSWGGRMPSYIGGTILTGMCVYMCSCHPVLSFHHYQVMILIIFILATTVWFQLVIWAESLLRRLRPLLSSGGWAVAGWRTAISSMSGWQRRTMNSSLWWGTIISTGYSHNNTNSKIRYLRASTCVYHLTLWLP